MSIAPAPYASRLGRSKASPLRSELLRFLARVMLIMVFIY